MMLFSQPATETRGPRAVLLFGSGLIGGAVAHALRKQAPDARLVPLKWTWPQPSAEETAAAQDAVARASGTRSDARVAVIWAAGQSGFGSTPDDMAREHAALADVRLLARGLATGRSPAHHLFVHVSSAGGLFEGQVACDGTTPPAPMRPYGHGKLRQEVSVTEDTGLGHRLILRPSSAYGYAPNGRLGLISAFAIAAIQNREAVVSGALTTLRDYLFAPDIGAYIARRVLECRTTQKAPETETVLLAAGRPASILEVLQHVEMQMGKVLNLRVSPRPDNARHNTFLPSALPEGFHPTRLSEGIAVTTASVADTFYRGSRL